MSAYEIKYLPDAVYVDTNALRQSGLNIDSPLMSELRSFTSSFDIPLCICELVLQEWTELIKKHLVEDKRNILTLVKTLRDYLPEIPNLEINLPNRTRLHLILRNRFQDLGFEIIPDWDESLGQLVEEAVFKKAPFQDGGKGLCDAIILESFIKHASNAFEKPRIIVLSGDKAVLESHDRFRRKGIEVDIIRTESLSEKLNLILQNEVALMYKHHQDALFDFIKQHESEILKYVRHSQLEFSDSWLKSPYSEDPIKGTIEKILSAKPTIISKVVGGAPTFLEGKNDEGRYPVDIWVDMELEVIYDASWWENYPENKVTAIPQDISESDPIALEKKNALLYTALLKLNKKKVTVIRQIHIKASLDNDNLENKTFDKLVFHEIG